MAKEPISRTFERDRVGGRRYSRGPDVTSPSAPTLTGLQAGTDGTITATWTWGTDAESGIGSGVLEYRTSSGPGAVTSIAQTLADLSDVITGIAANTFYDVRIGNSDAAGNGPVYSDWATVQTPPSDTQTAPGAINVISSDFATAEGGTFTVAVERTGQGVLGPIVRAYYVFENFSSGTPSPQTGELLWPAGTGGIQYASATAGNVGANVTGRFRITSVEALSGVQQPTLGTSQIAVTVTDTGGGGGGNQYYAQDFDEIGLTVPTNWSTNTDAAAGRYFRQIIADTSAPGGSCLRFALDRQATSDFRVQANYNGINADSRQTMCVGFSVLIEAPFTYAGHPFIYQSHHDNGTPNSADFINQVPVRLEAEPAGYSLTTIFTEIRGGGSGLPNSKTNVYSLTPGRASNNNPSGVSNSFYPLTAGVWVRFVMRMVWDERYSVGSPYPGQFTLWKNGVQVVDIDYPLGYGPHVAPYSPVGELTHYNHSLGIYATGGPLGSIAMRFARFRAVLGDDVAYCM